jgi:hypothetical protein
VPADAEEVRHLLLDQVLGDQLAAFHLRHGCTPANVWV